MPDYKKMYFQLTAKVTDAIDILIEAQRQGENEYIENEPLIIKLAEVKSKLKDGGRE
jgi:hypothetical protein